MLRFDVVVVGIGVHRPSVVAALCEALEVYEGKARTCLMELPTTVARSLTTPGAESAAATIRRTGASVKLVRNDG